MDASRFDALARSLGLVTKRRTALAAALGGVAIAFFGASEAAAVCKIGGAPCAKPTDCCSQQCQKKKHKKKGHCAACPDGTVGCPQGGCKGCCSGQDCPEGVACTNGTCACPAGTTFCRGVAGGYTSHCCKTGDTCDRGRCLASTCRADNSVCGDPATMVECSASDSERCRCFVTAAGGAACLRELFPNCPATSECAADHDCAAGETCTAACDCDNRSCDCNDGGPFFGLCRASCPAPLS